MNASALGKFARVTGGFLLLAAGIVLSLPGVPGPGILLIVAALFILGGHFLWARRLLAWMRSKLQSLGRG